MTDETPLARALRIATQNHATAYGSRNALDQGDYSYGTPVTYTEPNALSSSGLQQQGPWMRQYMPSTLADFLAQVMTYAPMAVPAMRGRVMENGLRPQDYATSNQTMRDGKRNVQTIMDPWVTSEFVADVHKPSMRQFKANTPQDMSAYVAFPEEVGFWAKQTPANAPSAEFARPRPSGNAHRDAIRMEEWKRLMRSEEFRPYDVIPGGKE